MLLPAPLVRWPVLIAGNFLLAIACCYALLLSLACYDLWSARKIQSGTLWGSAAAFTHNIVWIRIAAEMKAVGQLLP